jgi:hypothetical protein
MPIVVKGNKQYIVSETVVNSYLADGYTAIDEKGKVIKKPTGGISVGELKKKIVDLEKEIEKLSKANAKLAKKEVKKDKKKEDPKKEVKEEVKKEEPETNPSTE